MTPDLLDSWLRIIAVAACLLILMVKIALIWRIDFNWDEFYYLNHVYALVRGDLSELFQVTHTHLFRWLTEVPGDETSQLTVARGVMLALLLATAVLMWSLARRWASTQTAALAPLCYLATTAVLKHGGSFRTDSLLVPLSLTILLLFTAPSNDRRATLMAGACFGIALAITIKTILLIPVLIGIAWLDNSPPLQGCSRGHATAVRRLVEFSVVAGCASVVILTLHWLVLPNLPVQSATEFAFGAMRKSLLDVQLLPQPLTFDAVLRQNLLSWMLISGGAAAALLRGQYVPLSFGLSLLPILFYRNTFAYYYIVMLAPACVLAAIAADELRAFLGNILGRVHAGGIALAIAIALSLQAGMHLHALRQDKQVRQRAVIAAVHQIFPRPVAYIDHCGMISSFRKANFFMSTWGVEAYQARGQGFMREAIDRYRPPLLLANRSIIVPNSRNFRRLLPEDRRLIEESYVPYWGPIRIAGTAGIVAADNEIVLRVPFPGRYRLRTDRPVFVDGILYADREVIAFDESRSDYEVAVRAPHGSSARIKVQLLWADAQAPPSWPPPPMPLYTPL